MSTERIDPKGVNRNNSLSIEAHLSKGVALNGMRSPQLLRAAQLAERPNTRGKVRGWSSASRRRLREALLTHDAPDLDMYDVTLTVPGPPDVLEEQRLFRLWSNKVKRRGWSGIWRMEVQGRGSLHWHCILWLPAFPVRRAGTGFETAAYGCFAIRDSWLTVLEGSPCPDYRDRYGNEWPNRRCIPGAFQHAASVPHAWLASPESGERRHVQLTPGKAPVGGRGAWLRYLQDHASKHKQDQVAVDLGRHWGIFGRSRLTKSMPSAVWKLSQSEYFRVLRWLRRLATPYVKDARDPRGVRRGYSPRRGTMGRSVWFSRTDTVSRMVELAKSLEKTIDTGLE